jgi:ubiquinone/menaquinone biosynthesis C-methylase UbiE
MLSLKRKFIGLCPAIFFTAFRVAKSSIWGLLNKTRIISNPNRQELDIYWDKKFSEQLDTWGEGTVWNEIQFLLANCQGRVLDIACGTGKTIEILSKKFTNIVVYGCDISDKLIEKATKRGILQERLKVCDATRTDYEDGYFDYGYSIGSLEHFTEDGIVGVIKECRRIVKVAVFHQVPISKKGRNEGWVKKKQSYFNNNLDWWLNKFKPYYKVVYVLDSTWHDDISIGEWFICINDNKVT